MTDSEPTISSSFATPEELAVYTQDAIAADDPRVQPALDGASAAIRKRAGWHIWPAVSETLEVDGPGARDLSLPTLRLVELTSITENGTLLAPSSYRASNLGDIFRVDGCWSDHYGSLEVVMTHGYDAVPDLRQLVLVMAARTLVSPFGAVRESAGSESVTWAQAAPGVAAGGELLPHEQDVVDDYRIVSA